MLHDEMDVAGGGAAVAGGGGCCCAARAIPPQAALDLIGPPTTDVQRIMLRFRPIAPRPGPTKTAEEGLSVEKKNRKKRSRAAADGADDHQSRLSRTSRPRRGPKPNQKGMDATAAASSIVTTSATSSEEEVAFAGTRTCAATTPAPFPAVPNAALAKEEESQHHQFPTMADLLQVTAGWWERPSQVAPTSGTASRIIAPTPQRPVCSVIAVVASAAGDWEIAGDSVDDQQGSSGWLAAGCGEWGAKRMLETDDRPSVVSDRSGKVMFANAAYRRMVGAADDEQGKAATSGGMRTVLVAPPALLDKDLETFSCRVKVRWCGAGKKGQPEKGSVTALSDVYRLAGGTMAWRIDIRAALSLGPMGR